MWDAEEQERTTRRILRSLTAKRESFWLRERRRRPLQLFHEAARRVPAYKDFLKKQKIDPDKITTFKDFQLVPPVTKNNYLRKYPLEKLLWNGSLHKPMVWTSTSGSTGEPFYFPRQEYLEQQVSLVAEMFLKNSSMGTKGPILVIIGFGMGVWIGGLITYQGFRLASERAVPLSLITPGVNKEEIIKTLARIGHKFHQVILVGYPPFVKDIVDEAIARKIRLRKMNLRLMFAAEAFTEKFRDYLVKKTGIQNLYRDTLNIYGTADIGAMAWETPTSILVRRIAMKKKGIFNALFSKITKTPTLAQYNPLFITFEEENGTLLLTGNSALPLIRYSTGDHGGVHTFTEVCDILQKHKISLEKAARQEQIENYIYQLPFVYVYEREDFSTTLYGIQIYPEMVREALMDTYLNKYLTGKFTMLTKYDQHQDQYLEINLELKRDKKPTPYLRKRAVVKIMQSLRAKSSEFRELSNYLEERANPKIVFWKYEHPLYFRPGIKQRWVLKKNGRR